MDSKKFFYFFLLFFSLASVLQAQEINFGVKAGLNISTTSGEFLGETNPRLAYHLGTFAEIPVAPKLSFSPELLYNSIGFTSEFSGDFIDFFGDSEPQNVTFKAASRFNYISLPLNLKFNFNKRLSIELGPQVGFLINSVRIVKESNRYENEENQSSEVSKFDYGASLGMGYKVSSNILLQVRYYNSFQDTFKESAESQKYYHRVLQLSFGYAIF